MTVRKLMLSIVMLACCAVTAFGNQQQNVRFRQIKGDGTLSNAQVGAICKDRSGFLWFGTANGLIRYDGFRFRWFGHNNNNKNSIAVGNIERIVEMPDGKMWVMVANQFNIYDPVRESFTSDMEGWMKEHGMEGSPSQVQLGKDGVAWIHVNGVGCYKYNTKTGKAQLFPCSDKTGFATWLYACDMAVDGDDALIVFTNGQVIRCDSKSNKAKQEVRVALGGTFSEDKVFCIRVDHKHNIWVSAFGGEWIYSAEHKVWCHSSTEFLSHYGISVPNGSITDINDISCDRSGNLWIATDHMGLHVVNYESQTHYTYINNMEDEVDLPDNTLRRVYIDDLGTVWLGFYRTGVACYSPSSFNYSTVSLGAVNTIVEDKEGKLWCGTNDNGIVIYNPQTGETSQLKKDKTGLGSDILVSSLRTNDGSLWFGSFLGGLLRISPDNKYTVYREKEGDHAILDHDCIWTLAEDDYNNLLIGTLGAGMQILNLESGEISSFNVNNSQLTSNYLSSISIGDGGRCIVGHSTGISDVDLASGIIENINGSSTQLFSGNSVNQVLVDSRGLIWNANLAGLDVLDRIADKLYTISHTNGRIGQIIYSLVEDDKGAIWVASEYGISKINVKQDDDYDYMFHVTNYNDYGALQDRAYNYRSVTLTSKGEVVLGCRQGLVIVSPQKETNEHQPAHAIFSGFVLFDHQLTVGEEYVGRVILDESINEIRYISLKHNENNFTVQLASDRVVDASACSFMYRLKGFNDDQWMTTAAGQSAVTFTNLSSGTYELEVKVIDADGTPGEDISTLTIKIAPPLFLSWWMFAIYIVVILLVILMIRRQIKSRQAEKVEMERIRINAEHEKKIDEARIRFLTNLSKEMNTPLMLVQTPLASLIREEEDDKKRTKLELIQLNAQRLVEIVADMLNPSKAEANETKPTASDQTPTANSTQPTAEE